jgi:EF hand
MRDNMAKACERRTRTVMLKERRMANIPDITYDLDGDGSVNERDYALAKMFDKDGDGKLNHEEY